MSPKGSTQSVGPLKEIYTLTPGIPVHSGTNSASLGSILATKQYFFLRANTIHSLIHHCLWVHIYTAERTGAPWRERKGPNFETVPKWILTRALALSRSRVRHSTAELPRSDIFHGNVFLQGWSLSENKGSHCSASFMHSSCACLYKMVHTVFPTDGTVT